MVTIILNKLFYSSSFYHNLPYLIYVNVETLSKSVTSNYIIFSWGGAFLLSQWLGFFMGELIFCCKYTAHIYWDLCIHLNNNMEGILILQCQLYFKAKVYKSSSDIKGYKNWIIRLISHADQSMFYSLTRIKPHLVLLKEKN